MRLSRRSTPCSSGVRFRELGTAHSTVFSTTRSSAVFEITSLNQAHNLGPPGSSNLDVERLENRGRRSPGPPLATQDDIERPLSRDDGRVSRPPFLGVEWTLRFEASQGD